MENFPLVSVIMPVNGRAMLTTLAIESYLSQDYPNKELVVIDDGSPHIRDVFEPVPVITYVGLNPAERMTIGAKRNLACDLARGDIIVCMDSDDLSAPNRISSQVHTLINSDRPVTGYHTFGLRDISSRQTYVYHYNQGYVCGASLAFHRDYWEIFPFFDKDIGEDIPFTAGNRDIRTCCHGVHSLVVLLHGSNISTGDQVRNHPNLFTKCSTDVLPAWFRERYLPLLHSSDIFQSSCPPTTPRVPALT